MHAGSASVIIVTCLTPFLHPVTCPGDTPCNGHGKCTSMSGLAELRRINGDTVPTTYGLIPNNPLTWDFNRVFGCHCDPTWMGYDCSQRTCVVAVAGCSAVHG
jgi:hypothetical protein